MVTCTVFLRLSSLLKLAVLLVVIAVYTYLIEVAFHMLYLQQQQLNDVHRYGGIDLPYLRGLLVYPALKSSYASLTMPSWELV